MLHIIGELIILFYFLITYDISLKPFRNNKYLIGTLAA